MDKSSVFDAIAARVAKGELAFSTSARVAMKLRQALDDPECQIQTAAKLVQAEPLLSARVVAMANSVAFNRSGTEITDVRASVMRLGFRSVRSLAIALVTRQLAGNQAVQAHPDLAVQLWEHTAHVASLAHVLARRFTRVDPETAMFAGILHEVGGFYLLSCAHEFPGVLDGDFTEWMETGEAKVGGEILKVLAVPEIVTSAIKDYWNGYMAIPPATLGDTLLLAEELAPVPSPLRDLGSHGRPEGMSAGIDIIIGEEALSSILLESAEEITSLTKALEF